jgi:2,4-dienoyl-CoA reductase-like NADH-dependent reductase (Old Yellow Enzyme family)
VEILTTYSHTVQAADLRLCHIMALSSPVRAPRSDANHPWSLRDRLTETGITELITAYRNGATAASLATTHGVSLRSVKRLLHTAGIRRTPPTQRPTTTTPVATNR